MLDELNSPAGIYIRDDTFTANSFVCESDENDCGEGLSWCVAEDV